MTSSPCYDVAADGNCWLCDAATAAGTSRGTGSAQQTTGSTDSDQLPAGFVVYSHCSSPTTQLTYCTHIFNQANLIAQNNFDSTYSKQVTAILICQ